MALTYTARVLTAAGGLICVLENTTRVSSKQRLRQANQFGFSVPRSDPKSAELLKGRRVQLYQGEDLILAGFIDQVAYSDLTVDVTCLTNEIRLKWLTTPWSWSYDGWEAMDAIRDLVLEFRTYVKQLKADWDDAAGERYRVDTDTQPYPNSVILDHHDDFGDRYYSSGWIRMAPIDLGSDVYRIDKVRWAGVTGEKVTLTIQTRTGNTATPDGTWSAWSAAQDAVDDETAAKSGVAVTSPLARYIQVQVNFATTDTDTLPQGGGVRGFTPVLQAVEVVARYATNLSVGTVPATINRTLTGVEFDRANHLDALARICEKIDYDFRVNSDFSIDVAQRLGSDQSNEVVLVEGENIDINVLRDNAGDIVNVVTALGAGDGLAQLRVVRRNEASIAALGGSPLGERHGRYENREQTDLAALIAEADDYLADHSSGQAFGVVVARVDPSWPVLVPGDTVKVVKPSERIATNARILELSREADGRLVLGLNTKLYMGQAGIIDIMTDYVRQLTGPPSRDSLPPAPTRLIAAAGPGRIDLTWLSVAGDYFIIQVSDDGGATYHTLESRWTSAKYSHSLAPGATRYYKVYLVKNNRASLAAGPVSATAQSIDSGLIDPAILQAIEDAQDAAAAAQSTADTVTGIVSDITADDKLTAPEKMSLKPFYDALIAEQAALDAQATAFGITAEKTAYDNAVAALIAFATTKGIWTSMTATTDLGAGGGATFRGDIQAVLTTKQALLNAIAEEARQPLDTPPASIAGATLVAASGTPYQVEGRWYTPVVVTLSSIPADPTRAHIALSYRRQGDAGWLMVDNVTPDEITGGSVSRTVQCLPGVTYEFRAIPVTAFGVIGTGKGPVSHQAAADPDPPAIDTSAPIVIGGIKQLTVTFGGAPDTDLDRYEIQRREAEATYNPSNSQYEVPASPTWGDWVDVIGGATKNKSYPDPNVDFNRCYQYRYRGVDTGGKASGYSTESAAVVPKQTETADLHQRVIARLADTPVRQTVLSGKVSSNGQANFLVAGAGLAVSIDCLVYGTDQCLGGTAISGGDHGEPFAHAASLAVDDNSGTHWSSSQHSADVRGNAYIGYDFGVAKTIRKIIITQASDVYFNSGPPEWRTDGVLPITSIKIQYSEDRASWVDITTALLVADTSQQTILLPSYPGGSYLRVLANANPSGGGVFNTYSWGVSELQMMEGSGSPVVVAFAAGFDSGGAVDYVANIEESVVGAWSDLPANSTLYLYIDRNAVTGEITYGFSRLRPVYHYGSPGSPATDQHWFDLSTYTMKRWSGSAWEEKQRVFLGECVTNASSVTSIVTYALCGMYDSGWFPVSEHQNYVKTHALGCIPIEDACLLTMASDGTIARARHWDYQASTASGVLLTNIYHNAFTLRTALLSAAADDAAWGYGAASKAAANIRIIQKRGW